MAKIDLDAEIDSIRNKVQTVAPDTPAVGYSQTFVKADGLYIKDENGSVTGPLGGGLPENKEWLTNTFDGRDYPASPDTLDDEFNDATLDVKWTIANNSAGENALSTTKFPGQVHVGRVESADTGYNTIMRVYQTPPATGDFTMAFIIRCALSQTGGVAGNAGRWASSGVYLGESVNEELVAMQMELNPVEANFPYIILGRKGVGLPMDNYMNMKLGPLPGGYIYFKLAKTTNAAYTSGNTYKAYCSMDGLVWYETAYQNSFSFTANPNEVGFYCGSPSVQTGDVIAYSLVDLFRRVD